MEQIGKSYSVQELIGKIIPYKKFFNNSGGGVTLSGGEPTLYINFIHPLLQKLKAQEIQILLETNGLFSYEIFKKKILPFIDLLYMDLKLMDPVEHKQYCGVSNEIILENFQKLWILSKKQSFSIIPRIPLIPTITDNDNNLESLIRYLEEIEVPILHLLANNALWYSKCEKFGYNRPFSQGHPAYQIYPQEKIEKIKKKFHNSTVKLKFH